MALLKKLINLILYGNFWIATGAAALCFQTQYLLTGKLVFTGLTGLVFFATLFLYALHRIVGILRLKDFLAVERLSIIHQYRSHIQVYAAIGFLGALYCFWNLSWPLRISLLFPAFISLAYVGPVFSGKKRLRDIHHLKIFLIAFVFAWVTVFLPIVEQGALEFRWAWLWLFLERAYFIFAITIPFDIRDLRVDAHTKVQTIPARMGVARSIQLSYALLGDAFILVWFNYWFYEWHTILALGVSYLITAFLIRSCHHQQHDYYYTGVLDGMMILQALLVLGVALLLA